jgi:hypothetical protein
MAITDECAMQTGLQFHPESILTLHGDVMLRNVLASSAAAQAMHRRAEPTEASLLTGSGTTPAPHHATGPA